MKPTTVVDLSTFESHASDFSKLEVSELSPLEPVLIAREERVLDTFVSMVKTAFLVLPGALAIHFTILAVSLFGFADELVGILLGSFGVFLVGSFMVMLGLGKLSELRYLRVVAALAAGGVLSAVTFYILTALTGGDFFGWFALLSFPFNLMLAFLVKLNTDAKE